mgnify:FL=1
MIGVGAIFSGLAVALGAFGAHALKEKLSPYALDVFETGVKYQMYHALAIIAVGLLASRIDGPAIRVSAYSFMIGILVFSGSLYTLAFTGTKWLGAITPMGGLAFLVGWISLALACFR